MNPFSIQLNSLQYEIEDKAPHFESGLHSYLSGSSSSRWKVVFLAVWSGAYSPELDECLAAAREEFYAKLETRLSRLTERMDYVRRSRSRAHDYSAKQVIASSVASWLPAEDVSIVDVLEGDVSSRLQVAELLDQLDESVAYEYFCIWRDLERNFPLRHELTPHARSELLSCNLIRDCDKSDAFKFVQWITFPGLKAFMAQHGLPAPKGFEAGVSRIQKSGDAQVLELEALILKAVDPKDYFLLLQPPGLTRTMIMDVRVRAQALVALLTNHSENNSVYGEWNE